MRKTCYQTRHVLIQETNSTNHKLTSRHYQTQP